MRSLSTRPAASRMRPSQMSLGSRMNRGDDRLPISAGLASDGHEVVDAEHCLHTNRCETSAAKGLSSASPHSWRLNIAASLVLSVNFIASGWVSRTELQ